MSCMHVCAGCPAVHYCLTVDCAVLLWLLQVAGALHGVGDNDLAGKFEDACAKIKRDIIFAASLYL